MMGALGNGRRGGRSPSLLVGALIACVLLLGFNYWVSNSRNVELQSRILEMEDHMRQLAADRDREQQSKLKAEEETRRQNEQLELMEETHQRQQENALITWKHERENLKLNISSSAKTMQDMKNRMKSLMENVNKMQSELKSCQSNMDTISKKATSEMTQCNKQIEAVKEECNAKIAAAKLEKQKTSEKNAPQNADGSMQKVSVSKAKFDVPATNHSDKNAAEPPKGKPDVDSQSIKDAHIQTNELVVEKYEEDSPIPTSKLANKNETLNKPAREEVPEVEVGVKAPASRDADAVMDDAEILDPKEDDMGIGDEKEEDAKIEDRKEEDAAIDNEDVIMYDNEGEIEKQLSRIKDENQGAGQDLEDDVANYNGDDDNQPESEDGKQAELADM
ncbi:Golgi membrane protein 1-like [Sinocyclocheilus grahami]|uniref:Golgi membrane protein 1-like n=1 Tax=Sinocyclocheilus grahami TaxID=75366 RepID=A0A672P6H8_SINGR|nr:PREDICTED: Golgi membrane protein 1-like [Sinocyclocheilus grahami]XP_016141736.1 PREDICTED: Golgi membrane protein 1-like [Sinocyclocheilus grahami]